MKETRFTLGKEIIRYRFLDMVLLSLLMMLFYIPSLIFSYISNQGFLSEMNIFNELIRYLANILGTMIFNLALGGAFHFMKKLAYQEGASIRRDFFEGVFTHLKITLPSGFILGILYGGIHFLNNLLLYSEVFSIELSYIFLGLLYALFLFISMVILYIYMQEMIYNDSFSHFFMNGVKFSIGNFLKTMMCILILFPLGVIEFIHQEIVFFIMMILLMFFFFSLFILCFTMVSLNLFDQTINLKQYPELINKGLKKDED